MHLILLISFILLVHSRDWGRNRPDDSDSPLPSIEEIMENYPSLTEKDITRHRWDKNEWRRPTNGAQLLLREFKCKNDEKLYLRLKIWDRRKGFGKLTKEDVTITYKDPLRGDRRESHSSSDHRHWN